MRPGIGNRVFGCDDCLAVCPWNKFAEAAQEARLALKDGLDALPLAELAALDDASFRTLFAGTPVKRTGRDRFIRNVLIAIGNSGRPGLAPSAEALIADASPLVRAMAAWALIESLPRGRPNSHPLSWPSRSIRTSAANGSACLSHRIALHEDRHRGPRLFRRVFRARRAGQGLAGHWHGRVRPKRPAA
jgi:hypothetical protein